MIFGLVFFVIGRGMVPRVMDTVAMRDNQIAGDLAAAQAARDQADEQEEAWRKRENANRAEAQALIGSAQADAAAQAEKKLAAAQKRLDKKLAEADKAKSYWEMQGNSSMAKPDELAELRGTLLVRPVDAEVPEEVLTALNNQRGDSGRTRRMTSVRSADPPPMTKSHRQPHRGTTQ